MPFTILTQRHSYTPKATHFPWKCPPHLQAPTFYGVLDSWQWWILHFWIHPWFLPRIISDMGQLNLRLVNHYHGAGDWQPQQHDKHKPWTNLRHWNSIFVASTWLLRGVLQLSRLISNGLIPWRVWFHLPVQCHTTRFVFANWRIHRNDQRRTAFGSWGQWGL